MAKLKYVLILLKTLCKDTRATTNTTKHQLTYL